MDEGRVALDLLDLTLAEIDALEVATGFSLDAEMSATQVRDLLVSRLDLSPADALRVVENMTLAEVSRAVVLSEESLPENYHDGLPHDGGRIADRYIVACANAFNWPPNVTRQQTLRDLRLITEAAESRPTE